MLVRMDNGTVLELLMERLSFWNVDDITYNLYRNMYQLYIEDELMDCLEVYRIDEVVDNDYINDCKVICEDDEEYEGIKKLYDSQGLGDISCDNEYGYSFIEAEYEGSFLVRR